MSEKLATNIAMEVNAAISRIMSVIGLSFTRYVFNLFDVCSIVNRNLFLLSCIRKIPGHRRRIDWGAAFEIIGGSLAFPHPPQIVQGARTADLLCTPPYFQLMFSFCSLHITTYLPASG
ncbi:hypothetical protein GFL21_00660 [Rhizobium anhuiense]|uniref:hypothetical protein n=1 Tax=Rhizobium anhuiense TaxID=1184720 RepID=UPI0014427E98|nr:hypothetical protein [Rhizobium anhuiense]NKM53050.1 hypothetical protein [Rhizobium anhuiense]